ncbi:MBL fold metallo-hydrolase [Prosthecomicrobium pneumaticum]|uniref:Glyoxylase-like metal-dependent hydrolase (Beta-lactamase superfamily II) n=1 Tax=Prosthecomicrobium pneumaticum TaxID=81895 RepID=A0A7W9FL14_9HYPH|nr:glyoxylase-like metal-dependent hydrolase (beta-lactamase superfamily II) [Prosthecomicrobium pneumaticum]
MPELSFDRNFDPAYGALVALAPGVRRMTAPNPSPFTFHGTNTYVVGRGAVAVIDPGPDDERHIAALLAALEGERVAAILVTHSHRDHSPGARRLAAATGAPVHAEGPHRAARPASAEEPATDAGGDLAFRPDVRLADGALVEGEGYALEAVATPGHAANHLAFALAGTPLLFSGDHVMAWATTVIAPPDGAMADYMASLDRLAARPETAYLPGHGGPVTDAPAFVRALKAHRKIRERAILERIRQGDRTVAAIVAAIYRDTPAALHGAAGLSVFAHLEDLVGRGLIGAPEGLRLDGQFVPA